MAERHHMIGDVRGEPLAAGLVGARVRVPLTGAPGPHWSRAFAAHLVQDLVGHGHIGHLHLNQVVQGRDLVLDGVEDGEAAVLGACLRHAVEAANGACMHDGAPKPANMSPQEAAAIAHQVHVRVEDPVELRRVPDLD
jgi:hypothetical protein